MPVAVICGTDDRLTPPFLSEELDAGLPSSELHLLDGAGHMAMLERPEEVARIVKAFIEERFPAG